MRETYRLLTRWWTAFALAASLAMLGAAHAFERFGGLAPCNLCLKQREVYWGAVAVALVATIWHLVSRGSRGTPRIAAFLLFLIFTTGAVTAIFHAGGEWDWWALPATCQAGAGGAVDAATLSALLDPNAPAPKIVGCDDAAWIFLGISMAGWNALISIALAVFSLLAAKRPKDARAPADAQAHRIPLARPGPGASKRRRAEILRVDHAGEYAAVQIYRAQRAVFEGRAGKAGIAADMAEMQAQEAVHLDRFNALLNAERVRPTVMTPLWRLAALGLGAGTALMGEKAAHACTEAVEDVIEKHYAEQIAELQDRDPALAAELTRFREEELAHHDHAVEHGSREAPAYRLLSAVIKAGCRAAIKVSERV